jgi:xylan 1,4-beta-xylosidase
MLFHAYEKGFYNMGRQSLLLPLEWTKDGWYKLPENIKDDQPIKKPDLTSSATQYSLNDRFDGNSLKPHWRFFGEYDISRFKVADHSVTIKAKGNSVGDCSPLLCVPSDHSYIADVEVIIEGKALGGLVLFYNNRASSGILANNESILANINGWQFETEKNVIKNHVFLRLKNINSTVDMYYSIDGIKWAKIENSLETSGFHHNAFGGFFGIRIGLCSIGDGSVTFKNFNYQPINQ